MRYVYFPIELPKRELLSRLKIAKTMKAYDPDTKFIIVEHLYFERNLSNFPPGVILYKDFSPWRAESIWKKAISNNFKFFAYDEEGLYFYSDLMYRLRISKKVIEGSQGIFLNTNLQQTAIKKLTLNGKPYVVGHPKLFFSKIKSQSNPRKILINSKFTQSNARNIFSGLQRTFKLRLRLFLYNLVLTPKFYLHDTLYRKSFKSIYHLLKQKGYDVRFRKHPGESLLGYSDIQLSKNRLETDLAWADVVIHNGCTTGLEAITAGKIVINYSPHFSMSRNYEATNLGSLKAIRAQEILNLLSDPNLQTKFCENLNSCADDMRSHLGFSNDEKSVLVSISKRLLSESFVSSQKLCIAKTNVGLTKKFEGFEQYAKTCLRDCNLSPSFIDERTLVI